MKLFLDAIGTKVGPFKETMLVLRGPVKVFAGWWCMVCDGVEEHCVWKTPPTRLVHNFLIIDPLLTMFMPLES